MLILLALLAVVLLRGAWPAMQQFGWGFLGGKTWDPGNLEPMDEAFYRPESYSAFGAVFGTLMTSAIALVVAVPVSVGAAVFLVRIAPRAAKWTGRGWAAWIVEGASFMIELLAAIPSIMYGFWGILVLMPLMKPVNAWLASMLLGGSSGLKPARICSTSRSTFPPTRSRRRARAAGYWPRGWCWRS